MKLQILWDLLSILLIRQDYQLCSTVSSHIVYLLSELPDFVNP